MTRLVDSHCHVGHLDADARRVVNDARSAGVDTVVDIGMGLSESADAALRSSTLTGVFASVGIHPNDVTEFEADPDATMSTLRELARTDRVVAVGETGLDFYRDRSAPEAQEAAFRAHIELARELGRALVVHCRDAHARVLEVLDVAGAPDRVVMHCFSGDVSYASACAERGFFCSFAGNLTFKNSNELRAAAASVPSELLLVETDAPFLAPHPYRGKPNSPALLPYTARTLAEVRGRSFDELAEVLRDNCCRAFGIELD